MLSAMESVLRYRTTTMKPIPDYCYSKTGTALILVLKRWRLCKRGATGISFSFRFWIKQDVSRSCRHPRTKNSLHIPRVMKKDL